MFLVTYQALGGYLASSSYLLICPMALKSSVLELRFQVGEDDEMDAIGAEADDAEQETIRQVTEKELLHPANLLATFVPLVLSLCKASANKHGDVASDLQIAASLALAKLMLLSPIFCEKHLQLLFTLMEKGEDPVLRANLIVACGDLSFR